MSLPKLIELGQADFVTIDTIGPPGQRTFTYRQHRATHSSQ